MDIEHLRRLMVSKNRMQELASNLVVSLESFLGVRLQCFKRRIVDGESICIWVHANPNLRLFSNFIVEGVVLLHLFSDRHPRINAEFLLFGNEERIGLREHRGSSFLLFRGSPKDACVLWSGPEWRADDLDEWERYSRPQIEAYGKYEEHFEENS